MHVFSVGPRHPAWAQVIPEGQPMHVSQHAAPPVAPLHRNFPPQPVLQLETHWWSAVQRLGEPAQSAQFVMHWPVAGQR